MEVDLTGHLPSLEERERKWQTIKKYNFGKHKQYDLPLMTAYTTDNESRCVGEH